MTAREMILDVIESLVRDEKRARRAVPATLFTPNAEDRMAADLAWRAGVTVWIHRDADGLLCAMQPQPMQRH